MKIISIFSFLFCSLALATGGSFSGLPGVIVSGTPASSNLCLVSGSTSTASWGSCSAGSGIAGSWAASTGNVVTTNGASTAQDSGTALTSICTLTGTQTLTNKTVDGVSPTTFGFLDATSSIQTQLNSKAPTASPTFTGTTSVASETVSGSLKAGNYHIEPSENNAGNSSTAQTIDWSAGSSQLSTLTGNVTYTFSNGVAGGAYVLRIATGAGSFTATWPAAVKWSGGTAPTITTTASKVDLINFYYDGTNWYGSYTQNY